MISDAAARAAVLQANSVDPTYPGDCRVLTDARVAVGDRMDAALAKALGALIEQHARTTRCAAWYDDVFPNQKN